MSYPFVAAEDWSRGSVPVRAIAIHMAEGGGTVSWLTRPDGNSSHYVVEYTGRVVQMVREDRAAGSINPTLLRTGDDIPFTFEGESITYGATAAKAALGPYWSNPNAAVIAIETEGFAADGPNSKQRTALTALVADIRTRHPGIPALGHRDFQNYKACPGRKIPWVDYGGHGSTGGISAQVVPIRTDGLFDVDLTVGDQLYDLDYTAKTKVSVAQTATGYFNTGTGWLAIRVTIGGTAQAVLVKTADVSFTARTPDIQAPPPPPPTADYTVSVGGKTVGTVTLP